MRTFRGREIRKDRNLLLPEELIAEPAGSEDIGDLMTLGHPDVSVEEASSNTTSGVEQSNQ